MSCPLRDEKRNRDVLISWDTQGESAMNVSFKDDKDEKEGKQR